MANTDFAAPRLAADSRSPGDVNASASDNSGGAGVGLSSSGSGSEDDSKSRAALRFGAAAGSSRHAPFPFPPPPRLSLPQSPCTVLPHTTPTLAAAEMGNSKTKIGGELTAAAITPIASAVPAAAAAIAAAAAAATATATAASTAGGTGTSLVPAPALSASRQFGGSHASNRPALFGWTPSNRDEKLFRRAAVVGGDGSGAAIGTGLSSRRGSTDDRDDEADDSLHASKIRSRFATSFKNLEIGGGLNSPVASPYVSPTARLSVLELKRFPSYTHSFFDKWADSYPPIEEHGLIGNMHTVAMVTTDATINWFCYPHFDSPSVFASLLDKDKGGFFSIRAGSQEQRGVTHRQLYHAETNVLITRFMTDSGVGQVQDFMVVGTDKIGHGWLIRELEVVRGRMYFEVECCPAFNYARDSHEVSLVSYGARFKSDKLNMVLTSTRKRQWRQSSTRKGSVLTVLEMVEGQKEVFILRESFSGKANNPFHTEGKEDQTGHPASMDTTNRLRANTMKYWRKWISKCTYTGRWRETVFRSALALKLLTFEPTGAIVAAPTTSLPETLGGGRNWDYRFTWIRDSSFVLYAFLKLGFKEEAKRFMKWVEKRCDEVNPDGTLQIMYGIRGEHRLEEQELPHLSGYANSKPVRIGNGAFDQVQLDIYGELMDTVYLSNKYAEPISYDFWSHLRRMIDWVVHHWRDADEGIWEVRGGKQHFTYSKVMSWVAMDRAIRLAEKRSFPADIHKWRSVRDEIFMEIMEKGWNKERQAFAQTYGSDTLDASVLMMPLVFFVSPTDPRFIKTLDSILLSVADGGLVSNNLVFRYNVETTKDGQVGEEGTFSICTFWAVEALARLGCYKTEYLEKARLMFEQSLGYANHVGLYSEEIGRRGEHLGNFPQAFTHLALISAAFNLDKALSGHSPAPHL